MNADRGNRMSPQGFAELDDLTARVETLAVTVARVLMVLPATPALYQLCDIRATLAQYRLAVRALKRTQVSDVGSLPRKDLFVLEITRDWALPVPPPSVSAGRDPAGPKPNPL